MLAIVGPSVHRGPEVGKLEPEDDIGIAHHRGRTAEVVGFWEVHPAALVDHLRLQELGQLHQEPDAVLASSDTVGDDHRVLRVGEQLRCLFHGAAIALRRRGRNVTRNGEPFAVIADRLLLQTGVERDCDRSAGRRHGDLEGAHEGLREVLERDRRVVPFGEVTHQRVDVLRRVECRHARRPMGGIKIIAADDDHGHTIAPRVVDGHRGMLQTHRAVAQRHQRLAGGLEVAVRHADPGFLVRASEEFRHLVAAIIDHRFVDPAITGSTVRGHVLDVERLDDVDHEIGAGSAADARRRQFARRSGFRRRHMRRRRQRGGHPRWSVGRGARCGFRRRHRGCATCHCDSREELTPAHREMRMFTFH